MTRSIRLLGMITALAGMVLVAGCATKVQPGGGNQPAPPTSARPTSVSSAPTPNLSYAEKDNGRTVTVHPGDQVVIRLNSTYWGFAADTSGPALRQIGQPVYVPVPIGHGCMAGMGCGTVTATYAASSPGKAVIVATRTSCGEAMACGPGQGSYQLTVVIG